MDVTADLASPHTCPKYMRKGVCLLCETKTLNRKHDVFLNLRGRRLFSRQINQGHTHSFVWDRKVFMTFSY